MPKFHHSIIHDASQLGLLINAVQEHDNAHRVETHGIGVGPAASQPQSVLAPNQQQRVHVGLYMVTIVAVEAATPQDASPTMQAISSYMANGGA